MKILYRYAFESQVCLDDVEVALVLGIYGVEALCGHAVARLDVRHTFCRDKRTLVIDASTSAGQDLARLVLGFLRREVSEDDFTVTRIEAEPASAGPVARDAST